MISLTAFGKYIQNPISRIVIASASNIVSFMNIGDTGRVLGLEAEIRKDLYDSGKTRLYTFMNATYLNTEQDLDENKVRRENSKFNVTLNKGVTKDKLQGASEFLANANLGIEQKWGDKNTMDFVVSYSYISD